ncbi:MAG: hypothetical protein CMP62_02850 [Flavobacteriales bacterium]|nr:hypothetical protein [Flavobacteriales bacterium]|tara:strand:- start:602 stop:2308 length:1707 start_codon:yes stop_codon:yes gene_type:complete
MIQKNLYILFLFSFTLLSQNEKLRVEIIDIFKEYDPKINNADKINQEPIFSDTLKKAILTNKPILNRDLLLQDSISMLRPKKFRFQKEKDNFKKHFSFDLGSKSFINTSLHYTNGISARHNSGISLEYKTEDYLMNKDVDAMNHVFLHIYSNRFLNKKLLKTNLSLMQDAGLYWGGLTSFSPDSISKYNISNMSFGINLIPSSHTQFIQDVSFSIDYTSNNYTRNEFIISSSLDLNTEKALKSYSFHTKLDFIGVSVGDLSLYSAFPENAASILNHSAEFSDVFLKSDFIISGKNMFNYNLGVNFQYFPSDAIEYGGEPLIFPYMHLIKTFDNNNQIQIEINKELIYHSFKKTLDMCLYVDPYYRNSLSKAFNVNVLYNKRIGHNTSFVSNVYYLRKKGELLPFLVSSFIPNATFSSSMLGNPLAIYSDPLQRGFGFSSSFSFSTEKIDILIQGDLQSIKSKNHNNQQFVPKVELNSVITVYLTNNVNLISHWRFIGNRQSLRSNNIGSFDYVELPSSINGNLSLNCNLGASIFSIDFKNILGQEIYFFDDYYDNDRFKISFGFAHKF